MSLSNEYTDLQTILQNIFNTNTDSLTFQVNINQSNLDEIYTSNYVNYQQVNQEFIPVMINGFYGDYIPLAGTKALNQSVNVYLYVKQSAMDLVYDVLINTLGPAVIGERFTVAGMNAVFNMSKPSYNEEAQPQNISGETEYFFVVGFTLYMKLGIGFTFGNDVTYNLKLHTSASYTQIIPINPQTDLTKSPDSNQLLNALTSVTVIKENKKLTTLHFYYLSGSIYDAIAEEIETDIAQNNLYDLQIVYPNFTVTRTVVMESGSIMNAIGDFSYITAVFTQANTGVLS